MQEYYSLHIIFAVGGFAIIYLWFLCRQIMRERIELYDFIVLSTVAALPVSFVAAPAPFQVLSDALGISIPFILLYGMLFAIAYYFLIRLAMLVHQQRKMTRVVVQELALLRLAHGKVGSYEADIQKSGNRLDGEN